MFCCRKDESLNYFTLLISGYSLLRSSTTYTWYEKEDDENDAEEMMLSKKKKMEQGGVFMHKFLLYAPIGNTIVNVFGRRRAHVGVLNLYRPWYYDRNIYWSDDNRGDFRRHRCCRCR
jgi:hypothetical protein